MRSFDVFDTLIARKCIFPEEIFAFVGQETGIAGFARLRIEAEGSLQGGEYRLDDIYEALRRRFDLPRETLAYAKERELLQELDNVIPIARHLGQVGDGDLLVTDTYLPTDFVGRLLERAGLDKIVTIVRSAEGKRSGRIWRALQSAGPISMHLGDNAHSDGEAARRHGFTTTLSTVSRPSPLEAHLYNSGCRGIALLARILRLGASDADPAALALKELQANVNVPLLLLASLDLGRRLANHAEPPDRILFSSRDSRHWRRVFQSTPMPREWELAYEVEYFLTSRLARVAGSPDYLRYFHRLAGARSVVIDLCGTGLSLARLYARAALAPRTHLLLMIDGGEVRDRYREGFAQGLAASATSMFRASQGAGNLALELMNATNHGMVLDMTELASEPEPVFHPRFAPAEYSERQIMLLDAMASVIDGAVEWLADPLLEAAIREEAVPGVGRATDILSPLLRQAENAGVLAEAFLATHLEADRGICDRLAGESR